MYFFTAITVPSGLRSINDNTKLKVNLLNYRYEYISVYWVNYNGAPQKYIDSLAPTYRDVLTTYGTHPWILANAADDDMIAYFVPYTSDLTITVQ